MLAAGARRTIVFSPLDVTPETADVLLSGHTRAFIDAQLAYADLTQKRHIIQVGYAIEFDDNEGFAVLLYENRHEEDSPNKDPREPSASS